jgi:hypothetical protein
MTLEQRVAKLERQISPVTWAGLLAMTFLVRATAAQDTADGNAEAGPKTCTFEAPKLALAGSLALPARWVTQIAPDGGAAGFPDAVRKQMEEAARLPNDAFEFERRWLNSGDVLAKMRLRLGRKKFKGTARQLAKRCVAEIRAKWPAFKRAKPAMKSVKLPAGPAIYVSLERKDDPPYRVHFAVLICEKKGCGLFCYGHGPQVNLIDLSKKGVSESLQEAVKDARRLSPERLKKQEALFREFETVIVPSLRLAKAPPQKEAPK